MTSDREETFSTQAPPDPERAKPETTLAAPATSEIGQDDVWRQAHWALIATGMIRNIRSVIVPIVIGFVSGGMNGGSVGQIVFFTIAGVTLLAATGWSFANWLYYQYRLTDREVALRSGVFSKQERTVPYERIQAVNLEEAPLERLFRVVRIKIETAAGGQGEADIEIQAVSVSDAAALRQRLINARAQARAARRGETVAPATSSDDVSPSLPEREAAAIEDVPSVLLRRLSTRELLVAGATSGRVGAAVAIVGALAQFGDDLIPQRFWERIGWDGVVSAATSVQIIALGAVVFGVFAWTLAIVSTVLTFGGFELRREADQLLIQYGVLDRRRVTVPVGRMQAIRVVESMLRQPFGLAELRFETAGFGQDASSNGVLFPLLPRRDVVTFLEDVAPAFVMDIDDPRVEPLPERARLRYITAATIGWVVTVVVATAIVAYTGWFSPWWPGAAMVAAPGFALFGNARYRDAGCVVEGDRLLLRWRSVSRVTILTRLQRIQHRSLTSSPLQRRASLVTLHTAVASGGGVGGFALPHLDREQGEQLLIRLGIGHRRYVPPPDATWPLPPRMA